jgi:hypothetical protein
VNYISVNLLRINNLFIFSSWKRQGQVCTWFGDSPKFFISAGATYKNPGTYKKLLQKSVTAVGLRLRGTRRSFPPPLLFPDDVKHFEPGGQFLLGRAHRLRGQVLDPDVHIPVAFPGRGIGGQQADKPGAPSPEQVHHFLDEAGAVFQAQGELHPALEDAGNVHEGPEHI